MRKISSFGDPRLYALSIVTEQLTQSKQPLVAERVFVAGRQGDSGGNAGMAGMLGMLLNLLVAEKSEFQPVDGNEGGEWKEMSERPTREALDLPTANGPTKT